MSASTHADRAFLETPHRGYVMLATMGVTICQFLDMTIANVALPHMQTSLDASIDQITWVLTSFIIAGVMVMPLTGWLSDRFGSRNLFLAATAGFIAASMLCGLATSLPQMVLFRALQGISAAFIGPLSQSIMFDINPPSKQPRAMALWGLVVMIGPISGPFLGGFLTDYLHWRWVFFVNVPIGIPALFLLWRFLPSRPIVRRRLDLFAIATLAIALCALQLMLDRGNHLDWLNSPEIVLELMIAVSVFWIFFVHSRGAKNPLFSPDLLKNPNFLAASGMMIVLGITNVGLASVLPTMYQRVYGYSVMDTGMLMAPRGMGVVVTMLIGQRILKHVDLRHMIAAGYVVAAASMWTMTQWSLGMDSRLIVISGFVQGLGLGFVFVPMNLIAFATLAPKHRTDGATLLNLYRNLASSFGISVIVTMLARNLQTSHADVAASVTSYNLPFDPATTAETMGDSGRMVMAMLDAEANRQALMISYLDNFVGMFWVVAAAVPLALLLKPVRLRDLAPG